MTLHQEFLHADTRLESFEVGEEEAIKRALAFAWDAELAQAESRKECSPTVSLEYPEKKRLLWASAIEKRNEVEFLVQFQEMKAPKGFRSLFGSQERETVSAQKDGIGVSSLPEFFRLFYRGDFEALAKAIKNAKPIDGGDREPQSTSS